MFHSEEVKFSRDYERRDLHPTDLDRPISFSPFHTGAPFSRFSWSVPQSLQFLHVAIGGQLQVGDSGQGPLQPLGVGLGAGRSNTGWKDGNVRPTDMELRLLWPRRQVGMASCTGSSRWLMGQEPRFQGPWALPSADSSGAGLWTGAGVPGKGPGRGVFVSHYTRTSTFCQAVRLVTTQIQIPGPKSLRKGQQAWS